MSDDLSKIDTCSRAALDALDEICDGLREVLWSMAAANARERQKHKPLEDVCVDSEDIRRAYKTYQGMVNR